MKQSKQYVFKSSNSLSKDVIPSVSHKVPGQRLAHHVACNVNNGRGSILLANFVCVQGVFQVPKCGMEVQRQYEALKHLIFMSDTQGSFKLCFNRSPFDAKQRINALLLIEYSLTLTRGQITDCNFRLTLLYLVWPG